MCLAVPMQIKQIEDEMAVCEMDGVTKETSLMMLPDAEVGDYVLIHAGFAIEKLDAADAEETLRLFREIVAADEGFVDL